MPLIVSYFIIPLVFLLLAVNIYFRVKLVKQYKFLKEKNIHVDPKVMMKKKLREDYIERHHPEYKLQLQEFSSSMTNLVKFVIIGFVLLLLSFLYIYFTR